MYINNSLKPTKNANNSPNNSGLLRHNQRENGKPDPLFMVENTLYSSPNC
jgi:hypothetical protein